MLVLMQLTQVMNLYVREPSTLQNRKGDRLWVVVRTGVLTV